MNEPSDDYKRGFHDGKLEARLARTLRDLPSVQTQEADNARLRDALRQILHPRFMGKEDSITSVRLREIARAALADREKDYDRRAED